VAKLPSNELKILQSSIIAIAFLREQYALGAIPNCHRGHQVIICLLPGAKLDSLDARHYIFFGSIFYYGDQFALSVEVID
jgi:hypothetical protein